MALDKVIVSPYNHQTGTIDITYDDEYFSDISYNQNTGEITFTYNDQIIKSFVYVLLNYRRYDVAYSYEMEGGTSLLTIEGYEVPCPSRYRMTSSTIVDSGRNSKGILITTLVREGIRKIELEWNYLTAKNFEDIMSILESDFKLVCDYYDTILGEHAIKEFYSGDRSGINAQQCLDENGKIVGYENVKISLVEV